MSTLERRLPWIIVAFAALAGIAGYIASKNIFDLRDPNDQVPTQLAVSLLYPQPKDLPEFSLQHRFPARLWNGWYSSAGSDSSGWNLN